MISGDSRDLEREAMVGLLRLSNLRIASAMRSVRRHEFVPREEAALAYVDEPVLLRIGEATASAPHMVAWMLEAAGLREGERVLEIGGGMGYFAAVAAEMLGPSGHVYTVELDPGLAREAERRLAGQGYTDRVTVLARDGSGGLPERAPFDAVIVSCAAPEILPAWREQVRVGGRIVAPVGDRWEQVLLTYTRSGGQGSVRKGPACRFVPLRRAPTLDI
jgi:protein-L-isoaspartate(D-aspartate) O-methyltransferase